MAAFSSHSRSAIWSFSSRLRSHSSSFSLSMARSASSSLSATAAHASASPRVWATDSCLTFSASKPLVASSRAFSASRARHRSSAASVSSFPLSISCSCSSRTLISSSRTAAPEADDEASCGSLTQLHACPSSDIPRVHIVRRIFQDPLRNNLGLAHQGRPNIVEGQPAPELSVRGYLEATWRMRSWRSADSSCVRRAAFCRARTPWDRTTSWNWLGVAFRARKDATNSALHSRAFAVALGISARS
mmetsp:Transcript_13095/g.30971  ORF Transcript_13095/g.30971 Transcript_13095/m.30971 type:complete len:246 (-) Transcript_13095:229-966(-)